MGICVYIHSDTVIFFSMKHCVQTQLDLMHCMYMHMTLCKYMYIPDWFVLLHFGHSALLTMFVHTCTPAYVCTYVHVQYPHNSVDNTFLHYRFLSYYVQYLQYIIYTTSIHYIYVLLCLIQTHAHALSFNAYPLTPTDTLL